MCESADQSQSRKTETAIRTRNISLWVMDEWEEEKQEARSWKHGSWGGKNQRSSNITSVSSACWVHILRRWRTDHMQALWKSISHTLSDISFSDCSFFKELQRTPLPAHHYHVCFRGDSLKAFISLLAHESARHETISLEDHPPVPWWEAERWLHFLKIKETSFTFETRQKKTPSFHCQLCSNQSTPSPSLPRCPLMEIHCRDKM